ncbi:MAG: hypothetical protein JRI78_11995 [Deltaproteobacteria bacterium]|nr:hypothetical protein [Deltaproteobacteria bacterium]
MNRFKVFIFVLMPIFLFGQLKIQFQDYFEDKTMRIDYYHFGNAQSEEVTVDQIYMQDIWAGNLKNLIDPFNNGAYFVKVYDVASNVLIYSKGFNSIFGEYQTTDPAINGEKRTYHESALIPCPKASVIFVLEKRNKMNILKPVFMKKIDPDDVSVIREEPDLSIQIYEALKTGDVHKKVDLVWLAEGYTRDEFELFCKDVDRYVDIFFGFEPYNKFKKDFNITGVFQPSAGKGIDQPRKGVYKKTAVDASFNALGVSRYVLTENNRAIQDIASRVPYDAIVILVKEERYGGGGIYNTYAITTVDNELSDNVFIHEFGHSFAGLGDEYYSSSVAYNDFYPKGFEPAEPNITALLNPEKLKWSELVDPDLSIPTKWGKEDRDSIIVKRGALWVEQRERIKELENEGVSEEKVTETKSKYKAKIDSIQKQLDQVQARFKDIEGKVGAFEGAGYNAKGLYRPEMECLMFSNRGKKFCSVCQKAIEEMIRYFCN